MIHYILQFTLRIAAGCVLHRCMIQEIDRQKLYAHFVLMQQQQQLHGEKRCEKGREVRQWRVMRKLLTRNRPPHAIHPFKNGSRPPPFGL